MPNAYFRLRGWPEAGGVLVVGLALQFLDTLSLPQLAGPELNRPVFAYNLLPVVMATSVLLLLGSKWDSRFESASLGRSVVRTRSAIVVCSVLAWVVISSLGLIIGVVYSNAMQTVSLGAVSIGLVFGLRCWLETKAVAWLVVPSAALLSTIQWFVGENTPFGDTVGQGMASALPIISVIVWAVGAGLWIFSGRQVANH